MTPANEAWDNPTIGERAEEQDASRAGEAQRIERLERTEESVAERVGDPEGLAHHWRYQGETNDCAIYAEGTSLEAFGEEFNVEREREAGREEGIYDSERGTNADALGRLWERHGLAVERYPPQSTPEGAGSPPSSAEAWSRMSSAIERRRAVVAAVDSGPLWHTEANGGHAVWVTGMEERESGSQYVIVNDSGSPNGEGRAYPVADFQAAWEAHGYDMVITRDPFPSREASQ
jgi:hypothetical protein